MTDFRVLQNSEQRRAMARMLQMTTMGTRTKRMTVMDDLYCEYQLDILGYGCIVEGMILVIG